MTNEVFTQECVFKSTDEAQQIVYGVVSEPDSTDLQGDVLDSPTIEKMAHTFLTDYRIIGDSHSKDKNSGKIAQADAAVVESFIAPTDYEIGGQHVAKGSWVLAVKINDPTLWGQVVKGDFTGFSIGGFGERLPTN